MAKLIVDFSALYHAVEQMGAGEVDFSIHLLSTPIDPIDIQLGEGIEITLDEIEHESGLLEYKGRQILLYIKDHAWNVDKAVRNGADGKRFHVADCKTLQSMRQQNRFDRYHVTNKLTGEFEISGVDPVSRETVGGVARLKVCINCLKKLNYEGYVSGAPNPKKNIWEPFSIDGFFKQYSSYFKFLPRRQENDNVQYTEDWPLIASKFKAKKNFKCQQCHVDLSENSGLLHVHHTNGVKSDNRQSNLKALCADCHRKQASHEHMFVDHAMMQLLNRLRRQQSIGKGAAWGKVIELADPGVHGVLLQCKADAMPAPQVGYEIQDGDDAIVAELELAWPGKKVGVAIGEDDKKVAIANGWEVWEMVEVLNDFGSFKSHFG